MDKDMEKLNEEALDEVTGGIISGQGAGIVMGAQVELENNLINSKEKAGWKAGLNSGLGKVRVAGITQQNTTDLDSEIIYF